jgi:hypothetical protein
VNIRQSEDGGSILATSGSGGAGDRGEGSPVSAVGAEVCGRGTPSFSVGVIENASTLAVVASLALHSVGGSMICQMQGCG